MRIIIVGQGPFGEKVLDTLIKRGEDVVGVFCPPDTRGAAMAQTAEVSGGQVMIGGMSSKTVISCAQVDVLPHSSSDI